MRTFTVKTMRAAKYFSRSDIRIEEVEVPTIGDGEALVRVRKNGICGSDLADWYMEPRAPMFFGHEPAGDIVEIGPGVKKFEIGDRVFVHHHVPCFVCHHCIRGHFTMCETYKRTEIHPGGFAEFIRVPALNLDRDTLKLPGGVSYEEATTIEPIACAIKGMRRLDMHRGDTVAVLGAGFAGIVHVQLSRIFGAGKVFAVDAVTYRLERAVEFGADDVVDFTHEDVRAGIEKRNDGRLPDIVILATSSVEALEQGLDIAGKGATVYLFAPYRPGQTVSLDLYRFFFEETLMVSTYSSTHVDTREALSMIETGTLRVREMITHQFPLEEIGKAFEMARKAQDSLKIVVSME
jgi:L-iditol 2-dehydrogenase